nr:Sec-independent protein translocase subunit TatA [Actinomyces ruminicola]
MRAHSVVSPHERSSVVIKPTHIVVLLVLVLLIFGANKLPEIAGSIGKSMKVFKKEVKELREDEDAPAVQQPPAQIPQQPQQGTYYTQPTQPGQAAPQAVPPQQGQAPQPQQYTDGTVQQ